MNHRTPRSIYGEAALLFWAGPTQAELSENRSDVSAERLDLERGATESDGHERQIAVVPRSWFNFTVN
jgi:hypothetical protein